MLLYDASSIEVLQCCSVEYTDFFRLLEGYLRYIFLILMSSRNRYMMLKNIG